MQSTLTSAFQGLPEHIQQGAIIGQRFRVDSVIAEGGMGVVYKGWHLVLEHPIAIKVMRAEFASDPEAVTRFLNEARASAQLHGIHMPHVLDMGRIENGPPFMILEYLEGQDLRAVLSRNGPVPLSRAVSYILQACEAVSEVHAHDIVHRDLKPENLFITPAPNGTEILKVIDFGISKRLDSSDRSITIENQSLGSPQYMAPEQMATPNKVDWRADIWSLGVVLFELLTKSVPFPGDTLHVICVKVMCDEPVSLSSLRPDLPSEIERIVARCLCKEPEDRFSSTRELADALAPFAECEDGLVRQSVNRPNETWGDELCKTTQSEKQWRGIDGSDNDITPPPPMRSVTEANLRIPMRPRWPLPVGVGVILMALTVVGRSDTKTLEQVTVVATRAAKSTIHTVSNAVSRATGVIEFELNRAIDSRGPIVPSTAPSDSPCESIPIAPSPSPCPIASTVGSSAPLPSAHSRTPDAKIRRVLPAVQLGEEPMPDPPHKDYDPGI